MRRMERNMMKKPIEELTAVSVAAIQQYIDSKEGNKDRHQAFVLTSEKGASYPVVLYVYAQTFGRSAKVIVEWTGSCGRDYPSEFTTKNSTFRFMQKTLQIVSQDSWGNEISVSISTMS